MKPITTDLTPWTADARVAATIFQGAPCGIVVVDTTGTCMAANDAMVRFALLLPGAAGRPLAQVALPGVVSCVTDAIEECRITGEPYSAEHILEIASKETWWLVTSSPVHDGASGELTHVVCTFFYVDFLKRTEETLRRPEQTFRTLIERIPDAILVADRSQVRFVNSAAVAMFGAAQAAELVGEAPLSKLDPPDRRAVRAALRSAIHGDRGCLVEAHVTGSGGRRVTVDFIPISTLFEGRSCLLVVARDVTERNELHARLAQADRSIALGTLAAGVAHEINTPLTCVQTNISYVMERLEEGGGNPGELRQALTEAFDGVRRVARTVRELRKLTLDDPSAVTNFDAREVLEQVMRLAKPEVERKAKLVVRVSGPVGHVRASTLLAHVFLNLVQNAAQAIPSGADPNENEVRVQMAAQGGGVIVTVSDTGTGIAPEHLPRVFDPFFTTKPVGEGTGLGLALARQIVQASSGRIVARSNGKGATFEVWLPSAVPGLST